MKRTQLACYFLLASAFVLGGLMLNRSRPLVSEAEAGLVLSQSGFTIMTAQTGDGEEAIFVIDDNSQTLLVYFVDVGKERIELSTTQDLSPMVRAAQRGR